MAYVLIDTSPDHGIVALCDPPPPYGQGTTDCVYEPGSPVAVPSAEIADALIRTGRYRSHVGGGLEGPILLVIDLRAGARQICNPGSGTTDCVYAAGDVVTAPNADQAAAMVGTGKYRYQSGGGTAAPQKAPAAAATNDKKSGA